MDEKVAVVTGASSGIGKAICNRLMNNSYCVIANGRTINNVFQNQDNLILNSCDLLDEKTADTLLEETLRNYGRCDVLFVNAGIIESNTIDLIDIDKMCLMLRLKVEMSFRLIYTFLKYFRKIGRGHVIITSSVMGTKTRKNSGAYAACNHALEALAESLRMELSDTDIKITCIEPGLVETNLHRDWVIKPKELLNISHALSPEDIADAAIDILNKPDHIRIPRYMILPKGHKILCREIPYISGYVPQNLNGVDMFSHASKIPKLRTTQIQMFLGRFLPVIWESPKRALPVFILAN